MRKEKENIGMVDKKSNAKGVSPHLIKQAMSLLCLCRILGLLWLCSLFIYLCGCGCPLDCFKHSSRCHFRTISLALSVKCARCVPSGNGPLVFFCCQRTPWRRCGGSGELSLPERKDTPLLLAFYSAPLQSYRHARRCHPARFSIEAALDRYPCLCPFRRILLVAYCQCFPITPSPCFPEQI